MSLRQRFFLHCLSWVDLWRHRARTKQEAPHIVLARRGEDIAHRYAQRELGWHVLSRNFRDPRRQVEIDMIALDGDTLVITEVKTRTSGGESHPYRAVDTGKQKRIGHGARLWIEKAQRTERSIRFDVITVILEPGHKERVEHFRDAFYPVARPQL